MPYAEWICPDAGRIKIEDCFKSCRLKGKTNPVTGLPYVPCGRCLSIPTLRAVSQQREWTGKPSTTQLLRGTRESYLIIKNNYAIDPKSMMFALHGTNTHAVLEDSLEEGDLGEKRLDDGISTGAFDYYSEEDGGTLFDYKTFGSYVAAKYLGYGTKKELIGHYKNGKPRFQSVMTYGNAKHDLDLALQMNDYRMKIESQLGKPVANMVCEIIVRDGNTYMATNRGIKDNAYLVPVGKISDCWVSRYMRKKADDLRVALETDIIPPPCKPRECWHGRKCESFCAVREFCDYAQSLKGEK